MYCNSCHAATEHSKKRNYSIIIAILLLCLGIVPGIIYIVVKGKNIPAHNVEQ